MIDLIQSTPEIGLTVEVTKSLNLPHPVINMEVLAPPSDEKLIFTGDWLRNNALLVVIDPTEIAEQSGGQLSHHGREGVHTAHTGYCPAFFTIDLTSHFTFHSLTD